jgi:hypothetical protein
MMILINLPRNGLSLNKKIWVKSNNLIENLNKKHKILVIKEVPKNCQKIYKYPDNLVKKT